jgi:hypothetical protein
MSAPIFGQVYSDASKRLVRPPILDLPADHIGRHAAGQGVDRTADLSTVVDCF